MKTLFETTQLNHLELKNRLFRSATWEGLANPDGSLPERVFDIYRELAQGRVGAIVTGLTDVSPYNWALMGNMRLCSDALISDYKRLTDTVHAYGCKILVQLNIDQYVRPEKRLKTVPLNELTQEDFSDIVRLFTEAALRAVKAGFDGVQLHLAYGWLLNRSVNPKYNQRTDRYGGTTENRARLVLEILQAIRSHTHLHISAKFTFFKQESGDFAVAEGVRVCRLLSQEGIDSIEILGEHSSHEKNMIEAAYLDLALAAKQAADAPIILTGTNRDIDNMESLLNERGIAYFALCRPLIREPDLPRRWRDGNRAKATCISCNGCYGTDGKRCVFAQK